MGLMPAIPVLSLKGRDCLVGNYETGKPAVSRGSKGRSGPWRGNRYSAVFRFWLILSAKKAACPIL